MTSFFNKSQCDKIVLLALEAGKIASEAFESKKFTIQTKPDNSQVTSADLEVSNFLRQNLLKEFPEIPVICEEGDLRNVSDEIFFLIDPIDGTSSFINNDKAFAVNIALIKNKKAVFGLIYAPLFENGKMLYSNHDDQVICRDSKQNEKTLEASEPDLTNLNIITSARTKDEFIQNYIAQIHPDFIQNYTVEKLSSSVKFFRLLEGEAHLYLHFRPSMEWDIAAGQALVELMNGKVKKLFFNQEKFEIGQDMDYKKPDFSNQFFAAII
jgi:3'(2'), 5'-bisphosphate nucleotidase